MMMEIAFFFTFILACLCFVLYLATRRQLDFERASRVESIANYMNAAERIYVLSEAQDQADQSHLGALNEIEHLRAVLQLIAMPKRADGTYNRSREACERLAKEVLVYYGGGKATISSDLGAEVNSDTPVQSTQECKHQGRKFMNVLDLPTCSECFAVTVDTSNEGDK